MKVKTWRKYGHWLHKHAEDIVWLKRDVYGRTQQSGREAGRHTETCLKIPLMCRSIECAVLTVRQFSCKIKFSVSIKLGEIENEFEKSENREIKYFRENSEKWIGDTSPVSCPARAKYGWLVIEFFSC